jgi:membrane associated rhomboid family serine protease
MDSYTFLTSVERSADIAAVQRALGDHGIPYRCGLLATRAPRVVFTVPQERLEEARGLLAAADELDLGPRSETLPARAPGFPWRAVLLAGAVVAVHLGLVAGMAATDSRGRWLQAGGLIRGRSLAEPWRLITYLFLHVDAGHALRNGASLVVFAVPLIGALGELYCALLYLAAGIGGGMAAVGFGSGATLIVGSSGAVAGLFGAWVVLTLRYARVAALDWRARVRTLGIAFLVLPSLVTPVTPAGRQVSVSSHLGGLATGMLIGALLSKSLLSRGERPAA